jgi:hypothetical protein
MHAIEFDATVQERSIPLPNSAELSAGQRVRVVVLYEPAITADQPRPRDGAIAQLARNPLVIPDFAPLSRDEAHER